MKKFILIFAACSLFSLAACQKDCACPEPTPCEAVAPAPEAAPEVAMPAPEAAKPEMTKTAIEVGGEEIALPKPIPESKSLTECLQARRSVRAYTDEMISLEQLSALLWSASNRCGPVPDRGIRTESAIRRTGWLYSVSNNC